MDNITVTDTGAVQRLEYYEPEDKLVIHKTYDATDVVEANKAEKALNGKVKFDDHKLVKVASIHVDHIEALMNTGYKPLSADPDECRRAWCYIQDNEPDWMVVEGKPFALWRPKWR